MARPKREPVPSLTDARFEVCQIVGRLMELWGFRKSLGRIWAVLYLNEEPLSADEIADHLSLSRGSTSMALQELLRWGVVRKSWKPGERKDFFVAEENVIKMILRILNERELPAIDEAIHGLGEVLDEVSGGGKAASRSKADPQQDRLCRRTKELLRMTESGRTLFRALLGGQGAAGPFLRSLYGGMEKRE